MLDSLARPEQPPGQYHRPGGPGRGCGHAMVGRPVRYHVDLLRSGAVDIQQSRSGRLRHRDDHAGGGDDVIEDHALPWRRVGQHRVQDHDARHVHGFEQRNDVLAVRAAVNAVLVLHDHHVETVEHVGGRRCARGGAGHQVVDDLAGRARLRRVEHPDDGDLIARLAQVGEQRRGKCGQPALRGGIGAEQCVGRHQAPCRRWPRRTCGTLTAPVLEKGLTWRRRRKTRRRRSAVRGQRHREQNRLARSSCQDLHVGPEAG